MSRTRSSASFSFNAMSVEGNLLAPAILKEIANSSAPNQTESDYHVPRGVTLRDELARYFRIGQATFRHLHASSEPSLKATTRFVYDFLVDVLGFSAVSPAGVLTHDGHQFPVSLQALGGRVPIVVVPPAEGLEAPSIHLRPDGRRRSAAIALQDWLNVSDGALWGLTLVDELRLDGPVLRYVGFRAGAAQNDVPALATGFGLPSAPYHHETANNLDNPVRLNHIGIRVSWGARAAPALNGTRLQFWLRSRNSGAASPARTGSIVRCNGGHVGSACRQGKAL